MVNASIPELTVADTPERVPTVDGTRIEIEQINMGQGLQERERDSPRSWLRRARARITLFLAGMYTGIGCSGVPHSHHTYGPDRDRRPL